MSNNFENAILQYLDKYNFFYHGCLFVCCDKQEKYFKYKKIIKQWTIEESNHQEYVDDNLTHYLVFSYSLKKDFRVEAIDSVDAIKKFCEIFPKKKDLITTIFIVENVLGNIEVFKGLNELKCVN